MRVQSAIWSVSGGILQADAEAFSNEDGYHIHWQFSDDATGEMDLGEPSHRGSFWRGEVPQGVGTID